ncbi:MAG: HepT-like ribonuclease domain-containing protein, partial [Promethearchaeota archaeon]
MNLKDQYKRKLEFIVDKISILPENLEENEFYIDALFYRLQITIDVAMDVVAMLCKDLGISVKDDYSNMDELE